MLAYFMNFRVPGVNDVVVFRDHADPQQFYILNDRPRIAVDGKTGMPLFEFTLFSRNIEIAYASAAANQPVETQLGALNMTVDLSVSDADQARIAQFATNLLKEERVQPSAYNKLYKVNTTGISPRIGYIDWLTGTVKLETLEQLGPTFKRASSPETTPTLHGAASASITSVQWAGPGRQDARTSSRMTSAFSSSVFSASASSETRIWRALASMRFSPADRPRSLSRRHRSRTTSATLMTSPEASFSRLALKRRDQLVGSSANGVRSISKTLSRPSLETTSRTPTRSQFSAGTSITRSPWATFSLR